MSIDSIDRANIESNSEAMNNTLNYRAFDIFGAEENQANKIFRNLDGFQQRGGNDYDQAVEEYRKVFQQMNQTDAANGDKLPDLQLVDSDNDGDLDIQLTKNGRVVDTYLHQ